VTINLAASYALRDAVTVFARINNLFNAQYEDPLGFMLPGFGAHAGIRFTTGGSGSSASSAAAAAAPIIGPAPPSPTPRSHAVM
jgi:outer membrane receptor protein involved in Fe transport